MRATETGMGPSAHADEMSVRTNCRRSRESPFCGRRAANKRGFPGAYPHAHAMLNASLIGMQRRGRRDLAGQAFVKSSYKYSWHEWMDSMS